MDARGIPRRDAADDARGIPSVAPPTMQESYHPISQKKLSASRNNYTNQGTRQQRQNTAYFRADLKFRLTMRSTPAKLNTADFPLFSTT
jgi:hypothetical protein